MDDSDYTTAFPARTSANGYGGRVIPDDVLRFRPFQATPRLDSAGSPISLPVAGHFIQLHQPAAPYKPEYDGYQYALPQQLMQPLYYQSIAPTLNSGAQSMMPNVQYLPRAMAPGLTPVSQGMRYNSLYGNNNLISDTTKVLLGSPFFGRFGYQDRHRSTLSTVPEVITLEEDESEKTLVPLPEKGAVEIQDPIVEPEMDRLKRTEESRGQLLPKQKVMDTQTNETTPAGKTPGLLNDSMADLNIQTRRKDNNEPKRPTCQPKASTEKSNEIIGAKASHTRIVGAKTSQTQIKAPKRKMGTETTPALRIFDVDLDELLKKKGKVTKDTTSIFKTAREPPPASKQQNTLNSKTRPALQKENTKGNAGTPMDLDFKFGRREGGCFYVYNYLQ